MCAALTWFLQITTFDYFDNKVIRIRCVMVKYREYKLEDQNWNLNESE